MESFKSISIKNFLPYMCETTLESLAESMFKTELYGKLTRKPFMNSMNQQNESSHSDADANVTQKTKIDTDHSSNVSKMNGSDCSPSKEEISSLKIQMQFQNTDSFVCKVWEFICQRYTPYLEMLNYCKISSNQYGPIIRSCISKYFSEFLNMELKDINAYCKEHNTSKENIYLFIFGLKIIHLLSWNVNEMNKTWQQKHKKELDGVKLLYDRINMITEIEQMEMNSQSKDQNNSDDVRRQNVKSMLELYSTIFSSDSEKTGFSGLMKDSSISAFKCARSLLNECDGATKLDKQIENYAEACEKSIIRKRKIPDSQASSSQSQDLNDRICSIRKKRSHQLTSLIDVNIDGDSPPNMKSMGFIDLRKDKINNIDSQGSSSDAISKLNIHKKQDKSKIHKYSPFHIREQQMNEKNRMKGRSIGKRITGSNSFIGGNKLQTVQYRIKKARNDSSQKRAPSFSSTINLISQKSKSKEPIDAELQTVGEKLDEENSEELMPHPATQKMSDYKSSQNKENEFLSNLEKDMELSSRELVLVFNTPSKSDFYSQGNENDEINF